MKCARCLLRLQGLGSVVPSARTANRYAYLLQSTTAPVLTKPLVAFNSHGEASRHFHGSSAWAKSSPPSSDLKEKEKEIDKSLLSRDELFERVARNAKTKAAFDKAIEAFTKRDRRRRGHVEFIYAALQKMVEFGVERDLAVYNRLLDVFPKEVFVPRNFIQRMFNHYPRQQECAVQLLEQMENHGIMPNVDTKVLLVQIFGEKSHPMRKYQRLMYWFPRFKHVNPFPVPRLLPSDPVDLARLGLTRIANDLDAKVTVYQMPYTDITETGEEITLPHIVGTQSPDQVELLAKHDPSRPVFVEGPFPLWLRNVCVHYYVLRADPLPPGEKVEEPYDPERSLYYPLELSLELERDMGDLGDDFDVEDLDEGPVFAMCMTGQGDQATLNQWISGLQEANAVLGRVPTLFRLDAGPRELQSPAGESHRPHPPPETDPCVPGDEGGAGPARQEVDVTLEEEPQHSRGVKQ
ncbi:evolutionarily conserved signaling intermediate in Toll pathway, mitochondrial [Gadus morhua]|uniref:Evolutionarily conserved signaling intermediate in Toll pathway, mitochondrial n=1 Tax=Gadus morhua TaxID=8049 RepID=A0A8C5F5R8_GADMO|nr:evolutionarily conserved signaling intermediate in Toll pathway, mitochondrial [Gadus morhua]